jgi:predicted lactoylglutathione lyase
MSSEPEPVFILNLPVANAAAAGTFYQALGFSHSPAWSDDRTQSLRLPGAGGGGGAHIALMLSEETRFRDWIRPGTAVADARKTTAAVYALVGASRADVDDWLAKAVAAGGEADPFELKDRGAEHGMYSRSFADLDGHIWEVFHMPAQGGCQPSSATAV